MFFNLILQLKSREIFGWDPTKWYLLGDLNLGCPNLPHITPLFDHIVRLCSDKPGVVLNLFPYSQNAQGCMEANEEYIAGKKTAEYEDADGRLCGGFVLITPVVGVAAPKKDIVNLIRSSPNVYTIRREGEEASPSYEKALSLVLTNPPSKPSNELMLSARVGNPSVADVAEPLIKKNAAQRSWYRFCCSCFFSSKVVVFRKGA